MIRSCNIVTIIIAVIIITIVINVKNIYSILITHGLIIVIAERTGCFGEQCPAIGATNQFQQGIILIIILLLIEQLKMSVVNLVEADAQPFGKRTEKVVYFNRQMAISTQFVQ